MDVDAPSVVHADEGEMEKVRSVLRQFVRDWSSDVNLRRKATVDAQGAEERNASYGRIFIELDDQFDKVPYSERFAIRRRA
jgi:hypothetical protein